MTASHVTTILVTRAVIGYSMRARGGGPGYENTRVITNRNVWSLSARERPSFLISHSHGLLTLDPTQKKH